MRSTVAAEAVASTEAAASAAVAAILEVAELDRVLVEARAPVAQAAFVGVHLAPLREEGPELTVIDLSVRDRLGRTVAEARLLQVHVTAQRWGTERIQG